jgi:hypothetical protein
MQKNGMKFEWNSKCEESFQQLKEILTSMPMLNIEDLGKYFVVCTNAYDEGLDGVLTEKDHVVCYESRKLKEHERNYATHVLELTTIIHALKMWRHYPMGRKFDLGANHCGLKHLFGQPTLNARQIRCLEFFSEYDFDTKHIKGEENQVVYALNRRAYEMHIAAINMYMTNLKDKILQH